MSIKAELNYIEFHNTKEKLEPGYYRVIEADGDINIAKVERRNWERNATITWMSEQDHYHNVIMERDITEALRDGEDEFRRIDPLDLAEAEYDINHNSELFDALVYDIQPDDMTDTEYNTMRANAMESNQEASEAFDRDMEKKKTKSLADLLREAMAGNAEFSEPLVGNDGGFAVDESGLEAEQDEDDIPGTDPRAMSDTQYDELCAVTDQNRRDGVI